MTLKLITGCNEKYLNRIQPFLGSLEKHADFPVIFVGVGFKPDGKNGVELTHEQNAGSPYQTQSIQHGSFLQVVDAKPTDVLLMTDGDLFMQRPMNDDEKKLMKLKHGEVCVGWNGGPDETLLIESGRLSPTMAMERMFALWGEDLMRQKPIYNVGCIAMTAKTWQQVYDYYMGRWADAIETFNHQARQQWLISYAIAKIELKVKHMPWSFHAHGHFGLKPGMERRPDGIYVDGEKALFKHFL